MVALLCFLLNKKYQFIRFVLELHTSHFRWNRLIIIIMIIIINSEFLVFLLVIFHLELNEREVRERGIVYFIYYSQSICFSLMLFR